jgi:hypothetical protein
VKKIFRARKSEAGLSLIEVSIYSALILGGMAASYQTVTSNALSRKKVKQFLGYGQLSNYLRAVVTNQNNCGIGFGILSPNYTTGAADRNSKVVTLSTSAPTQVSLFSPIGEEYKLGVTMGAVTLTDLSITLTPDPTKTTTTTIPGSTISVFDCSKFPLFWTGCRGTVTTPDTTTTVTAPTPLAVPGSTDTISIATLNLAAKKTVASLVPVESLSLPIAVRLNANHQMVACSSYRNPSQALFTSAPCDQYSVASLSSDQNAVLCKKVLCEPGKLPVGFDASGQVICSSVQTACTGEGQAYVNVNGQYSCKQLACADPSKPIPLPISTSDPDGFVSGCTDLNSILISCVTDPNVHCKNLNNPKVDPGSYSGYICPNTAAGNQYKICTEDCTHKASTDAGLCQLIGKNHTATDCVNAGGYISPDPGPSAVSGNFVCAFNDTSEKGQAACPSGWAAYGKTYNPNPGSCPTSLSGSLDWNGRDGCMPHCWDQDHSFPPQFKDSSGAACKEWFITPKTDPKNPALTYYTETNGVMTYPAVPILPSGFKAAGGAQVDTSTFSCYTGMKCRLCGLSAGNAWSAVLTATSFVVGIDVTLKDNNAQTVSDIGGIQLQSFEDSAHCPQANVSYMAGRCDLNCYNGGVSSCHMTGEYQIQKVNFNVTTYCN